MAVIIFGALTVAALLFAVVLLTTLIGGVVGWIVGLVFPFVIVSLNTILGLSLTAFELGAMLGFVGSFFRTSVTTKANKD